MSIFDQKLTNAEILLNGYYPDDPDYRSYLRSLVIQDAIAEKEACRAAEAAERELEEQYRRQVQLEKDLESFRNEAKELFEEDERKSPIDQVCEDAELFLDIGYTSEKKLKEMLSGEGYPDALIEQCLACIRPDWKENALTAAKEYITDKYDVREELRLFLEEEGFTEEEREYAVNALVQVWRENAVSLAKEIMKADALSRKKLVEELLFWKVAEEDAVYAADHCGIIWARSAVRNLRGYAAENGGTDKITWADAKGRLRQEGFTEEESREAMAILGIDEISLALKEAERWIAERDDDLQRKSPKRVELYLTTSGYSREQIRYALMNGNWSAHASSLIRALMRQRRRGPKEMTMTLEALGFCYPELSEALADNAVLWEKSAEEVLAEASQ